MILEITTFNIMLIVGIILYLWLGIGVGKLEARAVPPLKPTTWFVLFWPLVLIGASFTIHKNGYKY